jgi:MFS family permease
MQLIAPDILAQLIGLSKQACIIGLVLGAALWLFGWWGHRFWIVLFTTVIAGLVGLASGKAAGITPLVAGVLLAVSAGMMALALARVIAFFAGGFAVCLLAQALMPTWEDRLLWFLGGGLAGLMLFRVWMMLLTSFAGTLLMSYSGLCLLDKLGKLNALDWTERRMLLLNWCVVGITLTGLLFQFLIERWKKALKKQRDEQAQLQRAELELEDRMRRTWWKWGQQRRAA